MRWIREGDILSMQWRDSKTALFFCSTHQMNMYGFVHGKAKASWRYRTLNVQQPRLVKDYCADMGGVGKSDWLI